jgi:alpha,alpha-trehalase
MSPASLPAATRKRPPRRLTAALHEIAADIAAAPDLAVLSDFDGVLAPIRKHPDSARIVAGSARALARLGKSGTLVAIVSGRGLTDVRSRVGLRGIGYIGCHGYLIQDTHGHIITLMDDRQKQTLGRIRRRLIPKLAHLPGILVEPKEAAIAIHYRQATPAIALLARVAVDEAIAKYGSLHVMAGKKVWEILPGTRVDKWTAVRVLLTLENRSDALLVYLGDDLTDERVFARMRGVSVFVGTPKSTAAEYFVDSPAEVRDFLERLAAMRAKARRAKP